MQVETTAKDGDNMDVKTIQNSIIFENETVYLRVGCNGIAESLLHKPTGTECLAPGEEMALFSVTKDRLFNNELKLAHPNKRSTFQANRLRWENGRLLVGFELLGFEAVVNVQDGGKYFAFTLEDFIVHPEDYGHLRMDTPPVAEMRLLQLPVADRGSFGEWLNVSFDDKVAVNVLATSPYARIDSTKGKDFRTLTADAVRGIKLKGCGAALIVSATDELLDAVEAVENDFDLPKGVQSRRSKSINASTYWTHDATPENVDKHIAYAKQGGFRMMLLYYTCVVKEENGYSLCGNYDFREEYPNGTEDLKAMLQKIKAAGITPGLHFLHTHIGMRSRYVTPVADHRLRVKENFTLAQPLDAAATTVYVEQNPEFAPIADHCRILRFGGELISYEGYTTQWPYCFTGCVRGYNDTYAAEHPLGTAGGVLDISEFGATSTYVDQNSSLQDEIADKLAAIYNTGFEFVYFDGSEGANPPYEFHIPNAQYRVYKKLRPAPLLCEGAAKAHFSWHMLSGGNAFDIFPTDIFKAMIVKHPFDEAPRMAKDFTRINFGWWAFFNDTQPDTYEYGTSRAAAWDCPATLQARLERLDTNPRTADTLEVMRRWEDVRASGWLTPLQKMALRDTDQEHTLLINEAGEYELVPYERIPTGEERVSAWYFERAGKRYVTCWHTTGEGHLFLPLAAGDFTYSDELGSEPILPEIVEDGVMLPIGKKRYLCTSLTKEELLAAFAKAKAAGYRNELQCSVHPLGELTDYKFVVICARKDGKWLLSRHKKRDTWETQGGHMEPGESPADTARRELFEESGAKEFTLYPVCDYCGYNAWGYANGVVFLADVNSVGPLPESEMAEVQLFETLPENLTYPNVSPRLFAEAEKLLETYDIK